MEKIKQALEEKKLALMSATKDLGAIRGAISGLETKYKEAELSVDGVISHAKEKAKEAALKACSADLEAELAGVEKELASLRTEKAAQLKHYSYESIKTGVVSQSPLGEGTQKLIADLKREAYDTVSRRFVDNYFKFLGKCRVSEDDFLDALDKLQKSRDDFFTQRDNKVNMFLESITDRFNAFEIEPEEGEEGKSSGALIGLGVVAVVLCFLVFPVYVAGMSVTYYLNIKKALCMKKSLDLLKVVEDNFLLMEKALDLRAYDEYHKKQQEIETEFAQAIGIVQEDANAISDDISRVRQETIATFKFDDSKILADMEETLREIKHSIEKQKQSERTIMDRIDGINKDIKRLEADYAAAKDNTISQFINFERVGEMKFFPEKFLLTDQEPLSFFPNGRCSNFFVYKDFAMAMDFIKLVCLQVRTRMAPSTCYTQLWDITTSGAQLMSLMNPNPKVPSNLFTIVNRTADIKNEIETLSAIFQKRLVNIMQTGKNINQYNEDMVKLKSVTEPYHLILVLSPETILSDENFKRLVVNGPEIGIYTYVFADILRLSDQYFPVIESSNFCAYVMNDKVIPNAQSALIESIKNKRK